MGIKHLYELVPSGLKKRIQQDRRKLWDEQQSLSIAKAWSDLSKHSRNPPRTTKAASLEESTSAEEGDPEDAPTEFKDDSTEEKHDVPKGNNQKRSHRLLKEELQARVELLKELQEGCDDPGTSANRSGGHAGKCVTLIETPLEICCTTVIAQYVA